MRFKEILHPTVKPGKFSMGCFISVPWLAPVIFPLLESLPFIPENSRGSYIVVAAIILAVASFFAIRIFNWNRSQEGELRRLRDAEHRHRSIVESSDPAKYLGDIGESVFGVGAWRISLFRRSEIFPNDKLDSTLVLLASASSDALYRLPKGYEWAMGRWSPIANTFSQNLTSAKYRQAQESGGFEAEVHSEAWKAWRDGVLGLEKTGNIPESLVSFPVRKFVWFGFTESEEGKPLLVLAESAEVLGVDLSALDHRSTVGWAGNISRLARTLDAQLYLEE